MTYKMARMSTSIKENTTTCIICKWSQSTMQHKTLNIILHSSGYLEQCKLKIIYHKCAPLTTTIMHARSSWILVVIDTHLQRAFLELTRANKLIDFQTRLYNRLFDDNVHANLWWWSWCQTCINMNDGIQTNYAY